MASLAQTLDDMLAHGKSTFSREEALDILGVNSKAFIAAAGRLIKKQRLASPYRGFYLILRPEDRFAGAPDPECWIDPMMKYRGIDYRISLLRSAAFHGASHQAAMVFQVIVPVQMREIQTKRHRVQFIYQKAEFFRETNLTDLLVPMKTRTGYAKTAGAELTLLDCVRYFSKAGGMNNVAQIVSDMGELADPVKLARIAGVYENSTVRRLGYILENLGHQRQSNALEPLAGKAKSMKPLNPSIKLISQYFPESPREKNSKWMLEINGPLEIDI